MRAADVATVDVQGYAQVIGRLKDMVICGGENLYPRALEELLYSQRKVSDVQAIDVPDAHQCEEVIALLILGQGQPMTPKEMIERRRAQVAAVTFPRHWKFVDQFPMMMTGKAQKCIMRQTASWSLADRRRRASKLRDSAIPVGSAGSR